MIEGVLHTTRGRILIGVVGVVLVVAVLFLTGVIGGNDYWDGGGYSGPVVNLAGEVTEEAHNELADCGYSDDDAKALTQGTSTETFTVENGEVQSTGTINTEQVAPGIVEVSCEAP